jgi:predicted nucleic acid-binding protein
MSGNRLFVDTNILLYFLKGDQEVVEMISDKDLVISFITELEILCFPKISSET